MPLAAKWEEVQTKFAFRAGFSVYNNDGKITKKKAINVIEGTYDNHNLSIFPASNLGTTIADTNVVDGLSLIESEPIEHKHYSQWRMRLNINYFDYGSSVEEYKVDYARSAVGAHELGHVLGLRDVDNYCGSLATYNHHEEVLMGYGYISYRSQDITYKDIAGVAITRGFHTDNDHKWLNAGIQSDGSYKLICSICNGVKNIASLDGYQCYNYNYCNGNHNLSSGNLMAVASYKNKDYFKCKYCRYVAPFENNVTQNYTYVSIDEYKHLVTNNVTGLEYSYVTDHNNYDCSLCGHIHTIHNYISSYQQYTSKKHKAFCRCGEYILKGHAVENETGLLFAPCVDCGYLLDLRNDIGVVQSILKVSANGSRILSNGIIVLEPKDVDAYLNGTLVFSNYETEVSTS